MQVFHELSPIYDNNSKVLILGSMPSRKSREIGFYYAHKTNRFWMVLEKLFNVTLNSNKQKQEFLIDNHIALWDIFSFCEIDASSDASIKNYQLNDIEMILKCANIRAIFCTGKKSFDTLIKNFKTDIPIYYLPSPSSANAACNLETLVAKYKIILNYLT